MALSSTQLSRSVSRRSKFSTLTVQGEFQYNELIPHRSLEDTVPFLEEKEREEFLAFARQMLAWHPETRKTARELMDHPFLKPI